MNNKKSYALPDYKTTTTDIDEYNNAWKAMAAPVEAALGISLIGFDPEFLFSKGNPQLLTTEIVLPVWFVRDLSKLLTTKEQ